jgi:pantetheine-phosphate adenylyltransferase
MSISFFGALLLAMYILQDVSKGACVSQQKSFHHLAAYPGSFDPLTNGHLDIVRRGAELFDTVVVAVYTSPKKNVLFSADERVALWQEVITAEGLQNVRAEKYTGLTTEYMRQIGAQAIIKGLRSSNDFEAEFQQGLMNHKLAPEIETVCLFTNLEQLFVSSSLIKEVASLGADVTDMLPASVMRALQTKQGLSK